MGNIYLFILGNISFGMKNIFFDKFPNFFVVFLLSLGGFWLLLRLGFLFLCSLFSAGLLFVTFTFFSFSNFVICLKLFLRIEFGLLLLSGYGYVYLTISFFALTLFGF